MTPTYTVTYDANGGTGTMTDNNSPYEANATVTLLDNALTAPEGMMWNSWLVKDADDNTISVSNNQFTMPASNVTVTAQWVADPNATQYEWVLTDLADLTSDDIFVIVGTASGTSYSMSNDNGTTNPPSATAVTIQNERITSTVSDNIKWNISGNATDGYSFYPNGSTTTWLYCTATNNGVRVGTNGAKTFKKDNNGYLQHVGTARILSYYDGQWRCYGNTSNNPLTVSFYKRQVVNTDPYITANDVELAYNDTEGTITYVLHNASGNITSTTTADWITSLTPNASTSTVAIVCTANNSNDSREATVVLAYGEATKEVTVSQAANPNAALTTMDEIFARATEVGNTATDVTITLNNWVVSGANDSSHAFVTDGTKGFMIYATSSKSNHGFNAGDILSGTVQCKVQLYNGSAEITNLTSASEGLTVTTGGNVAVANIAMANLQGINTGALVRYENLTCSVTTSGNYTNYNLTDGTTTIQAYHTLIGDLANYLVDGKTYNITGVFVQNNSIKRIMPRSAADIVEVINTDPSITVDPDEVTVSTDEQDGTLGLTYENLTIEDLSDFAIQYYDAENNELAEEVFPDWIEVEVAEQDSEIGEGYVVSYYVYENDGEARTAYFKVYAMDDENNLVYSNLVTITQAAYVAPPTPGNWVLTSLADLTENDVFVIVGDNGNTYAMSNDKGTQNPPVAVAVTVVDGTLSGEPVANIQWTLGITDDGYIFYPNGTTETWLYCTNANNGVRVGTGTAKHFTLDEDYNYLTTKETTDQRYIGIYNAQDWRCYKMGDDNTFPSNIADQTFAFYKRTVEPENHTLTITPYGNNNDGWNLIASPVTVDPSKNGMTDGDYDLYYFDQTQEAEWRNYKQHPFNLEPGKGYLYAHKTTGEFTLSGTPNTLNGVVGLTYSDDNSSVDMRGWNLIGNPLGETAYLADGRDFYRMNSTGSELIVNTDANGGGNAINALEGIFVKVSQNDEVTFTTTAPGKGEELVLNVTGTRGNVIDRAIVRFGEGRQLPKFQLNKDNTKIYFAQADNDYAVVSSDNEGEMPVSFKAAENGTYTLSFNAENTEMRYMHLIDNMTGNDIDLLQTPSYSFEAKTTDYASRFRLVFSTGNADVMGEEHFAFFNGSEWVISNEGEATLQVIDMTGRVLTSETINGNANVKVNQASGVYVMRLIQNGQVRSQKIVKD